MFRTKCDFLHGNVSYKKVNNIKLTTNCTSVQINDDELATQSPIAIVLKDCVSLSEPTELCLTKNFYRKATRVKIENNGLTAMITLPGATQPRVQRHNSTKNDFQFEQCHFHWSDSDHDGSEHSVDGKKYVCEAHFVHFNTKYGTFEKAADKKDGLLVIGVLMDISDFENHKLNNLIDFVYKIPRKNTEYIETSNSIFEWLEDVDFSEYIAYKGSLTTDPFYESVFWFLAIKPITISKSQMKAFRQMNIYNDGIITKTNARCLQKPPVDLKVKYTGGNKLKAKL